MRCGATNIIFLCNNFPFFLCYKVSSLNCSQKMSKFKKLFGAGIVCDLPKKYNIPLPFQLPTLTLSLSTHTFTHISHTHTFTHTSTLTLHTMIYHFHHGLVCDLPKKYPVICLIPFVISIH